LNLKSGLRIMITMHMNTTVIFDSSVGEDTVEILLVQHGAITSKASVDFFSGDSQALLAAGTDLLETASEEWSSVDGIALVVGVERFTAARLVAVTVNSLGWSLGIPVRSYSALPTVEKVIQDIAATAVVSVGNAVDPFYTKDPRIS